MVSSGAEHGPGRVARGGADITPARVRRQHSAAGAAGVHARPGAAQLYVTAGVAGPNGGARAGMVSGGFVDEKLHHIFLSDSH